ncbi:MAG: HAMP domain-containing histidine kinase [Gammaproteobacteria bacterium]|nr:HAMP domain-containing histidine kinase [Gammaproteobacteria bacterium]
MSSSMKISWPATLATRLTLWYTLLSTLSFVAVFLLAYFLVATLLLRQVDDDLVEDVEEFSAVFNELGLEGLWLQLQREVEEDGAQNLFFQLFDEQGVSLRSTNVGSWQGIPSIADTAAAVADSEEPLLQALDLEQQEYQARTVYGSIRSQAGNYILQIAEPLEERAEVLELVRGIFLVSLPLFVLASISGGRFMARRSLSGVEEVTATAIDISNGALTRRVSEADRGAEIEKLAATFNTMLDKIQVLIKGMREMTDNIAHDLKSPLASIRGTAETTLTSNSEDPALQQLAGSIIEECDRLLHLINTMLDLSETEAGLTPEREPLNLTNLIRDACELYQVLAYDSAIELHCVCEEEVYIDGNRQFLQRLIGNLLDNAIKYTPAGGEVSIEQIVSDTDVVIKVRDTGQGISEEDMPRIFERFYRADQSRTKPGTGLGLSLARAIVNAHLGSIAVQSSDNGGSLFTVRLPRHAG